jgi:hypothetical protein
MVLYIAFHVKSYARHQVLPYRFFDMGRLGVLFVKVTMQTIKQILVNSAEDAQMLIWKISL